VTKIAVWRLHRHRQWRQGVRHFTANAQRFAAGGQDAETRSQIQQLVEQGGAGVDDVLAVIHDQEQLAVAQKCGQRLIDRGRVAFTYARRARDRLRHRARHRQCGQIDEPRTVMQIR
jgi:hypothetical protein